MLSSNVSSSPNLTRGTDWSIYSWCTDFPNSVRTFSALSVICFLVGFPASLWVFHELVHRQRKRSCSDLFMLNLAFLDLVFTSQIPFNTLNFVIWQVKDLQYFLDLILSWCLKGRPLFMACICWDCYMAVVHPIVYKTNPKLPTIKMLITTIIYFNVVVGVVVEGTQRWLLMTPFIATPLFVSLPVIVFCDLSTLRSLRKRRPAGNIIIHPQRKRALHIIFSSFVMTLVVYLPPTIIFSFGALMPLTEAQFYCCINCYGVSFSCVGCVIMSIFCLLSLGKLDMISKWWKK